LLRKAAPLGELRAAPFHFAKMSIVNERSAGGDDGGRVDLQTVETLDSVYLRDALEAVLEAGDPEALYRGAADIDGDPAKEAFVAATAKSRRIKSCRRAVLYSSFAAEAFINSFIAATLSKRDRSLIDRNRTIDKYILGPRLALTEDLSELEQREELQTLERLFAIRNRLVHPKPRELTGIVRGAAKWRSDDYSPANVADFLIAVGDEAYTLSLLHEKVPLSATAYLVVLGKERIREFGQAVETLPQRGTAATLTMEDLERAFAERFGVTG
jgi:hypothetical protein